MLVQDFKTCSTHYYLWAHYPCTWLRFRIMLSSRASLSTGYVPGSSIGGIHHIWKWIEHQLDKEKPR
jgi:hypothetical protein